MTNSPHILDMTAGSRMFWWDKHNKHVVFLDKREGEYDIGSYRVKGGTKERKIKVSPDVIADWSKCLPFEDNSFNMVVFDPPHLLHAGADSWLAKKYGVLSPDTWEHDLNRGFSEGMRVLKTGGTLIFKWNDDQIKLSKVLKVIGEEPLFGDKRSKTHWLVFMKF